jgi:predicted MFS family arabinose efflux permease
MSGMPERSATAAGPPGVPSTQRLPTTGLLALATGGFITILTEALPASLLPQMSAELDVSATMIGQLVTLYAVGSLIAAIPLTAATQRVRRRPLLLSAIAGFAVVNTVTAISDSYAVILVARFFAGVFAGLLWSLLAGYAARMAPDAMRGKAIAIAMIGTPLALSIGIPAGTLLGGVLGWRTTFGLISALAVLLVGWVLLQVPDFAGQPGGQRLGIGRTFRLAGLRPVLFVTLTFVLAHNILYTYIAPFVEGAGLASRLDLVLLVFGLAALLGIWIVGLLVDRMLRRLVLASTALFALTAVLLAVGGTNPLALHIGMALWGLAFGGAATLFQTAAAQAAGRSADVAQAMIVTVWNIAIAGGGLLGGMVIDTLGAPLLPHLMIAILLPSLLVAWQAKRHGFPL